MAKDIFEERGIGPEIWKERPYERWELDNLGPVVAAFESLGHARLQFELRIAAQSPGYLIHRFAPPGLNLPHVYPEFRPDKPVRATRKYPHWHGDVSPEGARVEHGWLIDTSGEAVCRVLAGKSKDSHVARGRDEGDHRGQNVEHVHRHERLAKYVFPRSGTIDEIWSHDHHVRWHNHDRLSELGLAKHVAAKHSYLPRHDEYHQHSTSPDARHLAKRHRGEGDIQGEHEHHTPRKDPTENLARRIDLHPLAVEKILAADVVFFGIEGCLKADSILGQGAAVFSVPSVSLWGADELPAFVAAYLRGKALVIVPDADWHTKREVISQARLCHAALRRLGVREVHIAAPPIEALKGVDDFLGAGNGLVDLETVDYELSKETIAAVSALVVKHCTRSDQRARNREVLTNLAMFAGPSGEVPASLGMVAKVMNRSRTAVGQAIQQLESWGAVTIEDGGLETRRDYWSGSLEWEDAPAIVLAERFRAQTRSQRLGDVIKVPLTH